MRSAAAVLIMSVVVASCAPSHDEPPRDGESKLVDAVSEERFEKSYQRALKDGDVEQQFIGKAERAAHIYFSAHEALDAFDESLDRRLEEQQANKSTPPDPPSLVRDTTYQQLVAYRIVRDSLIDEADYVYRRLLEESRRKAVGEAEARKQKAQTALRAINQFLRSRSKEDVLAHLALFERLRATIREYNAGIGTKSKVVRIKSVVPLKAQDLLDDPSRIPAYENKHAKELQKRLEQARSDTATALSSTLQRLRPSQKSGPGPRQKGNCPVAICPDPGPDGNLSGVRFPEPGMWALTYDDGPHPRNSVEIADAFRSISARATFFWVAERLDSWPEVIDRVNGMEMVLASHSYTHANLSRPDVDLNLEVTRATKALERVCARTVEYFRLPYGAGVGHYSNVREHIADAGLVHVFWNVDSIDYHDRNPVSVVERVQKQMALQGRGIILMHDLHSHTVEVTRTLLKRLSQREDVRLLSVPEAVEAIRSSEEQISESRPPVSW